MIARSFQALEQYGCIIFKHFRERLRYQNALTNSQTGDRIVICEGPTLANDIPRQIPIGKYRATILYKGQPKNNRYVKCSMCLENGHRANECENDWRCKSCGETGHKQSMCTNGMFSDGQMQESEASQQDLNSTSWNDDCTQLPTTASTDREKDSEVRPDTDGIEPSQSILTGPIQGPVPAVWDINIPPIGSAKAPSSQSRKHPAGRGQNQRSITSFVTGKTQTPNKQLPNYKYVYIQL